MIVAYTAYEPYNRGENVSEVNLVEAMQHAIVTGTCLIQSNLNEAIVPVRSRNSKNLFFS